MNRERRSRLMAIICVGALTLLGPVVTAAQGPPPFVPAANPVSDAVRTVLARESRNLVGSAELMPAEKYAFQPTPAQITSRYLGEPYP